MTQKLDETRLQSWMELAQAGDKHAYRKLLEEVELLAHKYVYKKLSSPEEADDVVQEILTSVHKARHTYDPIRPFFPWLYAIFRYRLQDYFRRYYRNQEHPSETLDDILHTIQLEEDEGDIVEKKQFTEKILSHLNDKQRSIVTKLYIDGHSAQEVSDELELSVADVRVTAHRALKKLKDTKLEEV